MERTWDISISVGDTSHVDSCELMGMQYKLFLLALLMGTKLVPTQGRVIAQNPDVGWFFIPMLNPSGPHLVSLFLCTNIISLIFGYNAHQMSVHGWFMVGSSLVHRWFIMKLSPVLFIVGLLSENGLYQLYPELVIVFPLTKTIKWYSPLLDRPKSSHSHYSLVKS